MNETPETTEARNPFAFGDALSSPNDENTAEQPVPGIVPEETESQGSPSVQSSLDEVAERLVALETAISRFHERSQRYEQVNLKMNDLVVELKEDSDRKLLKPVFTKLAALSTDALNSAAEVRDTDRNSFIAFSAFTDAIEDIFSMYDLDSVGAEPGKKFDSSVHAAVQRKDTDNTELDGVIDRVLRQGYSFYGDSRPYLPAQVSVWRYKDPTPR